MKKSTVLWLAGGFIVLTVIGGGSLVLPPGTVPDIVQAFANAIAIAEGFYVNASRPQRNNNPGDIMVNGQFVVYATPEAGWAALYDQVYKMFYGGSAYYNPSMTIQQVANHYAPDGPGNPNQAENWAANVASTLGVSPDTTLQSLIDNPPTTAA